MRGYLRQTITHRWFGRTGSIGWLQRSSDLTPKWIFEGVVKNKFYEKNPKTVNDIKDYIHDVLFEIGKDRNLYSTVFQNALDRRENDAMLKEGIFSRWID